MLKLGVPSAPIIRSQSGRYISVPRAPAMSPMSKTSSTGQPKLPSSSLTSALAAPSLPHTKITEPGTCEGSTMIDAFTVFSDFTTRASGNSRWICSPTESSLHTDSVGGMPLEKSSGLEASISTFPLRFSGPAMRSASTLTAPGVQLKTTSPNEAASPKLPSLAPSLAPLAQSTAFSLPAEREPIFTSCPSSTSLVAIVWPTMPVPRTPMRMALRADLQERLVALDVALAAGPLLRALLGLVQRAARVVQARLDVRPVELLRFDRLLDEHERA